MTVTGTISQVKGTLSKNVQQHRCICAVNCTSDMKWNGILILNILCKCLQKIVVAKFLPVSRGLTYMSWQPAYACVNGIEYVYQQFANLLHAVSSGFVSLKPVC